MVQITVSDELARAIAEANAPVMLIDSRGQALGQIAPMEPADSPTGMSDDRRKEIQRRMQEPGTYVSLQTIKERLGW